MNQLRRKRLALSLALGLGSLLAAGCTDGTTQASSSTALGTQRFDFVLRDLAHPDLFAFHARVAEIRLEDQNGELTENYLNGEAPLDLQRPMDTWTWLSRIDRPRSQQVNLVLRFAPDSYRASLPDGSEVAVVATSHELRAPLSNPGTLVNADYVRCDVAIDLGASLTGDASLGSLQFTPTGNARLSRGIQAVPLESRLGIVVDRDLGSQQLTVDLHADEMLAAEIGRVRVRVPETALLIDNLDQVHQQVPFFFTYFTPGLSVVDVLGMLGAGGELNVLRVELEDQNGVVVSPQFPVKALVRVTEVLNPSVFRAQLRGIRRGSELLPLMPSGAPEIEVNLTGSNQLVFHQQALLDPGLLEVGMELLVKSRQLVIDPLLAGRIEVVQSMGAPRLAGGRLVDAAVSASSSTRLVTRGGEVLGAFAGEVATGPAPSLIFELDESTVFQGHAADGAELGAADADLEIEVQGVATGSPGLLRATRVVTSAR